MRFFNRLGYHDYEGISLDGDERNRLIADLGTHHTLILRNHGTLTAGASVNVAFELMYYLEMACRIQTSLPGCIDDGTQPPSVVCECAAQQFERSNEFLQQRDWEALLRLVERLDPGYREYEAWRNTQTFWLCAKWVHETLKEHPPHREDPKMAIGSTKIYRESPHIDTGKADAEPLVP